MSQGHNQMAVLAFAMSLGATETEAMQVINKFMFAAVPTTPQALLDQTKLFIEEVRQEMS